MFFQVTMVGTVVIVAHITENRIILGLPTTIGTTTSHVHI